MAGKLKGASVLVTGANGGIGLETVKLIVREDIQNIALACRTKEKANWAKTQLKPRPSVKIEAFGGFDMNSIESIYNAVKELPDNQKYDVVFLQSGGMVVSDTFQFNEVAGEKIERNIFQNVLGGYLTIALMDEFGLLAPNARIVFAGGEGARGIKGMITKPEFASQEDFKKYISAGHGKYNAIDALGVSKFTSGLLVQCFAGNHKNYEVIWFSPGLTARTNGLSNVKQPKKFVMEKIGFPLMQLFGLAQSPKKAALKNVDCLNGTYGVSGELLGAPEGKTLGKLVDQKPMNPGLTNRQFREVFWKLAQRVKAHAIEQSILKN